VTPCRADTTYVVHNGLVLAGCKVPAVCRRSLDSVFKPSLTSAQLLIKAIRVTERSAEFLHSDEEWLVGIEERGRTRHSQPRHCPAQRWHIDTLYVEMNRCCLSAASCATKALREHRARIAESFDEHGSMGTVQVTRGWVGARGLDEHIVIRSRFVTDGDAGAIIACPASMISVCVSYHRALVSSAGAPRSVRTYSARIGRTRGWFSLVRFCAKRCAPVSAQKVQQAVAALVKFNSSASVTKYRKCRSSIKVGQFYRKHNELAMSIRHRMDALKSLT